MLSDIEIIYKTHNSSEFVPTVIEEKYNESVI